MLLIKPSEISGRIMTLIEESEKCLVLISPYVKVSKWYKLKNKIDEAKAKNIAIEFYIRKDNENALSKAEVESLNIVPIEISNLHSKLYFNEKQAIITSMNLLLSSDINSLEIGYLTETQKEYDEIVDYYSRYISKHKESTQDDTKKAGHWLDLIFDKLELNSRKLRIKLDDSNVTIETGINSYQAFLWNKNNCNILRISGILSKKEFDIISKETIKLEQEIGLKIEMQPGQKGYYDLIWGTGLETLKSESLNSAIESEYIKISNEVYNFITIIDNRRKEII